jgi:hypothetical protein
MIAVVLKACGTIQCISDFYRHPVIVGLTKQRPTVRLSHRSYKSGRIVGILRGVTRCVGDRLDPAVRVIRACAGGVAAQVNLFRQ